MKSGKTNQLNQPAGMPGERHQLRFRSHVFSQQTTDLKTDRKFSTLTRLSIENFQANINIFVSTVVCC